MVITLRVFDFYYNYNLFSIMKAYMKAYSNCSVNLPDDNDKES